MVLYLWLVNLSRRRKNSGFKAWGILFRRFWGTLVHHYSVTRLSKKDNWFCIKLHTYKCGWLFGFYDISIFVGYLMPNSFYANSQFYFKQFSLAWVHGLIVKTFLFQAIQFSQTVRIQLIQFSISSDFLYTQVNVKTVPYQTIQFSVSKVSMSKTVAFQTIQLSISTQFKCKYTVYLSKTFPFQAIQFSQTVLIQTIQFSISPQLILFNLLIGLYHVQPFWARMELGVMAMKG